MGKTLTVLAYLRLIKDRREQEIKEMLKSQAEKENEPDEEDDDEINSEYRSNYFKKSKNKEKLKIARYSKPLRTLIILPSSLMLQWQSEIENKFERNAFKVHVYHDANRKKWFSC